MFLLLRKAVKLPLELLIIPHELAQRDYSRQWLKAGLLSLLLSGLFSIIIVLARTPGIAGLINDPMFARKSLVLEDYKGQVVVITSVYASCADTCPMILDQVKRTLELLSQIARFYRLDEYHAHLLTGEVDYVNYLLDRLNVSRTQRSGSADIDHANLFMLIDREGTLAFRFTLGERQKDWMTEALRVLIREEIPGSLTNVLEK